MSEAWFSRPADQPPSSRYDGGSRAILVLFGAVACLLIVERLRRAAFVAPLDYNEGWNAYFALRFAETGSPYQASGELVTNNYPPLWFALVALVGKFTPSMVAAGRLLSTAGLLLLLGSRTPRSAQRLEAAMTSPTLWGRVRQFFLPDVVRVQHQHADELSHSLQAIGGALGTLRNDGWSNPYTGIGTSRDKMVHSAYTATSLLAEQQCSTLFHSDDIARRICTTRPEEMLRAGYVLTTDDEDLTKELLEDAEALAVDRKLYEVMCWGKCFGGAALVLGVKDGRTQEMPLDESRVRSIEFLSVLDRRYVFPEWTINRDKLPVATTALPISMYRITSPLVGGMSRIHESRLLRFEGELTDMNLRIGLNGWTVSTLQCAFEVLQLFGMSFASVGHLLQDASQGVFKMKDLMHMIANNRDALTKRMELVDISRSVARAVLLDADQEDFTRVTTSFASLPELLDRIMQRMSAATKIPVTLLMGRSAAGMNATGDSDFRAFYDSVGSDQKKILLPALLKIYRMLAVARGADPAQVRLRFNKLWEPTEQEESLTEKQDADRDVAYINAGVLLPEEVALRIKKGSRKVCDTEIDGEAREKSLKIELEMMKDPAIHAPAAGEPGGPPLPAAAKPGVPGAKPSAPAPKAPAK